MSRGREEDNDGGSKLDPEVHAFLRGVAVANGWVSSRDWPDLRRAIDHIMERVLKNPRSVGFNVDGSDYKGPALTERTAVEAPALEAKTQPEGAAASPAATDAPPAAKPPRAASSTPTDVGDLHKATPKTAIIAGKPVSIAKNAWRGVFVQLAEHAISAGRFGDIPSSFTRDAEDKNRVIALSNAKYLYANLNKTDLVRRTRELAKLLGVQVSVEVEREDGGTEMYDLGT